KFVMPAKAGIQNGRTPPFPRMDSRFRGNDETMQRKMCECDSPEGGEGRVRGIRREWDLR
ncbi:MAG: hypothetical protein ACHQRJ_20900, partial [Alphaproteobacteria bacterium]